jgi:hypothetical protein
MKLVNLVMALALVLGLACASSEGLAPQEGNPPVEPAPVPVPEAAPERRSKAGAESTKRQLCETFCFRMAECGAPEGEAVCKQLCDAQLQLESVSNDCIQSARCTALRACLTQTGDE